MPIHSNGQNYRSISLLWQEACWRIFLNSFHEQPDYSRKTRALSCLLIPWLHASPGHQQKWYREYNCLYSGWIFTTCVILMSRNDIKCKYICMFLQTDSACNGLSRQQQMGIKWDYVVITFKHAWVHEKYSYDQAMGFVQEAHSTLNLTS